MAKDGSKFVEPDESTKLYFKELSSFRPIKKEDEHKLIKKYKDEHDISARNKLIKSNLRYASKLATKYVGNGVSYSELISEANNGLFEAIDRFDLSKNVRFITYSKWWIIQKIETAIKKRSSLNETDIMNKYDENIGVDDDDDCTYNRDYLYDDEAVDDALEENVKIDDSEIIVNLLSCLNQREEDIIKMYYGVGYDQSFNLEEIGDKHSLTKERVKQIIKSAFKKVRTEALLNEITY